MKNGFFTVVFIVSLFTTLSGKAQTVPVVNLQQLQSMYIQDNDTTYILNFWATWCVPCVEELPYIEKLNEEYKDKKLKIILASMDGENHLEDRLIPYLQKNQLKSKVVLFSEPKPNNWIPIFDPDWSGAIPATIVRNGKLGKQEFFEKKFEEGELEEVLKNYL